MHSGLQRTRNDERNYVTSTMTTTQDHTHTTTHGHGKTWTHRSSDHRLLRQTLKAMRGRAHHRVEQVCCVSDWDGKLSRDESCNVHHKLHHNDNETPLLCITANSRITNTKIVTNLKAKNAHYNCIKFVKQYIKNSTTSASRFKQFIPTVTFS